MRAPRGKRTAGGSSKTRHSSRAPQLPRVLIADDNLAEREMYASNFAAHGQAVFAARASPAERRSRGTPDVTAKGVIARTLLKGYHWRPPCNKAYSAL